MIIKSAEFLKSATNPSNYPESDFPEIAFVGRSNAGKSSLINALLNRKNLVKTSAKPGCTQLINFFEINKNFTFVDLPGYGYARVPEKIRKNWQQMAESYITTRKNLKGIVMVMDIRRKPEEEENAFCEWIQYIKIPYCFAMTKADKISKSKQKFQTDSSSKLLIADKENLIIFSAKTLQGKNDLWTVLKRWIEI